MKKSISPPIFVPRLNSLHHRLRQTPGPEDEPYLDQLMIFLDDPPRGVTDRWKKGAQMCAAWGIACSGTSVWRLYRSYAIEWRTRVALQIDSDAELPGALEKKAAQMLALRTCEILANPATSPNTIVGLARIELRQKALDLSRQKYEDSQRKLDERAIAALQARTLFNREARFPLERLKEALEHKPNFNWPFSPVATPVPQETKTKSPLP